MSGLVKQLKKENFDVYTFFPSEEDDEVNVEGNFLEEKGEKVGGNDIGDMYTIILFRESDDQDCVVDLDRFEAILTSPPDYLKMMLDMDWYGVICKKTTTSDEFCNKAFDSIKEAC